ncbi:MAG: hypothetical protein KGI69_04055 [Patescibacteria group bacterium]|nr:hypothetical protein [Patescibacteria group bacterium]
MKMRRPNIAALSFLAAGGAVIVAACAYIYLYEQTGALTDRALLAADVVAAEKADKAQGTDIMSVYQSTASSRARLPGLFVSSDDAVRFITAIEAVGPASGAAISISSIVADPSGAAAPGTIGTISASVVATGSWSEAMRAFALLESLPLAAAVDRAALTLSAPATGASKAARWTLSLDMHAAMMVPVSATSTMP